MRIAIMGDFVPGGILYDELLQNDFHVFPKNFQTFLDKFDIRVCNLECPLYDGKVVKRNKAVILRAPTKNIKALKNAKIDLVSLGNNHIFDYGVEGLQATISLLKRNNINYIGAGMSLNEARIPYIVTNKNTNIGFLAYDGHVRESNPATYNSPGIAPLNWDFIEEDVAKLKNRCDCIILLLHWGKEYRSFPSIELIYRAEKLLKAGVNLIIGNHAHCIQGKISKNNRNIFFSLGNFLFPDFYFMKNIIKPKVMIYPNNKKNYSKKKWEWSLGSRISLLLDINCYNHSYNYKCIPLYQTRKKCKVSVLRGVKGMIIKFWFVILSTLYNTKDLPKVYKFISELERIAWEVIFKKKLKYVIVRGIKAIYDRN